MASSPSSTQDRGTTSSATARATIGILVVLGLLLVVALMSANGSQRTGPTSVDLPVGRTAVSTPLGASDTVGVTVPSIGLDTTKLMELGLKEDKSLQSRRTPRPWAGTDAVRRRGRRAPRSTPRT